MFTDYSPHLPYERQLHQPINPGFKLTVNGHIPHDCTNFTVNLKCGQQRPGYPEPNIALHLSFRFNEGAIVRNSKIISGGAVWGPEERHGGIPLPKNQAFQLDVIAEAYAFKILLNHSHFAEFKYRLPLNTVSWLEVNGHVNIYQVNAGMPGGAPGLPLYVYAPAIPTTINIPGNMQTGMCFGFSGMANHGAQRFHINFNTVNGDAALHFNPRMNESTVVRTSRQNGHYSGEERHGGSFPFYHGQVFHMLIRVHHSHYEVLVNGQLFTTFNHRIHPITSVKSITIDGGVTMHAVNITR